MPKPSQAHMQTTGGRECRKKQAIICCNYQQTGRIARSYRESRSLTCREGVDDHTWQSGDAPIAAQYCDNTNSPGFILIISMPENTERLTLSFSSVTVVPSRLWFLSLPELTEALT
ncbi:hypothetical protein VOLCADRAFT_89435 [Volvox carteri f. nagariensis]|uniref:Uncharacterized protein n=1 Tax=Volvox carteri f. nagariensis TaxID=3068 RepID=D8TRP2_VOLCA|nr:uncharacterized protein VOLCADRAFT_89435 [Volvox carteri f. nagariensis]EFJ49931.1 hypothetical protein VOLCADRAFT_89435 [Volvox carteri f. nagariensis]|eukprot:XP_002948996.1 hypothetical protein VOLCADRAFT_89435 [Volvox carteri f. nagariensis]